MAAVFFIIIFFLIWQHFNFTPPNHGVNAVAFLNTYTLNDNQTGKYYSINCLWVYLTVLALEWDIPDVQGKFSLHHEYLKDEVL